MSQQTRFGLPITVIKQIQQVLRTFPQVTSATLYGSRAKGNYRAGSDIDLCLKTQSDAGLDLLTAIMEALDNLDLAYGIDVSLQADIGNDKLLEHIQRVGIEFYNATADTDTITTPAHHCKISDITAYLIELQRCDQQNIAAPIQNPNKPTVIELLNHNPQLKQRQRLVEYFISNMMPSFNENDDISQQFLTFWSAQKQAAITTLCADENMDITAVRAIIDNPQGTVEPLRDRVLAAFKSKPTLIERKFILEPVMPKLDQLIATFNEH
jgi:predicted nucleotidyltransferase